MAKFSKKMMGKEVGDASVYAEPHNMKGQAGVDLSNSGYGKAPKKSAADKVNMSVGNINRDGYAEPKTSGIKTRGNGCATKGTIARGPMA
jgi:hypothetical protein